MVWVNVWRADTDITTDPYFGTHRAKFTEIWSEKVTELSNLGSNLTYFGAKPTIPDVCPVSVLGPALS